MTAGSILPWEILTPLRLSQTMTPLRFDSISQISPSQIVYSIEVLSYHFSQYHLCWLMDMIAGMRPVMYSTTEASQNGLGWVRCGRDINHSINSYPLPTSNGNYYTLSFTIDFKHPNDTVLIAYTYPYTTKDYRRHMEQLVSRPESQDKMRVQQLCQTIAGFSCDLVTITDFVNDKDRIGLIGVGEMSAFVLALVPALVLVFHPIKMAIIVGREL